MCLSLCFICGNLRIETRISYTELLHSAVNSGVRPPSQARLIKSFDELRESYSEDDRLHVPARVFNALLNRPGVI
jgi:hypothetical protein